MASSAFFRGNALDMAAGIVVGAALGTLASFLCKGPSDALDRGNCRATELFRYCL